MYVVASDCLKDVCNRIGFCVVLDIDYKEEVIIWSSEIIGLWWMPVRS